VRDDVVIVLPVPLPPLLVRQGQRVPDRGRDVRHVPRVDQDGARPQRLGRPRELGQHQHARVVGLAGDELVGHQVHAVAQGGDEADVGDRVERGQLGKRQLPVQVVDGDVGEGAVAPVDAAHDLVDEGAEAAVLGDVGAGGDRDLDEQDLVPPLGVLLQELFKGQQLLGDALDHVEAVDAEHDL
jgi:hypothetical protein